MGMIICTGNRLAGTDDLGPRVYDRLARSTLPPEVELLDGGLAGLDLLPLLEVEGPVVLVDSLGDEVGHGGVVVLDAVEAAKQMEPGYGHDDGLAYLLRVAPAVAEAPLPRIHLVGAAGVVPDEIVAEAAEVALRLAGTERQ